MKWLVLCITLIISLAYSADNKTAKPNKGEKKERTYTEKEFQKAVNDEVMKKIEHLKKTSLTQLTKEILEKEEKLNEREDGLKKREQMLALSEKTLEAQTAEFLDEKKKILGCVNENERKESVRVAQLVKMVSGMKPVKAAELLSVQDSEISVKILERIDPVKASKIFNSMDKEVSARLQKQYLDMKQ